MNNEKPMDWLEFTRKLEAEGLPAKITFLAKVGYELTTRARDTYELGTHGVSEPARLRAINEVMHRLTHRSLKISQGSDVGVSERDFWQMLFEISEQGGCLKDLIAATSTAALRRS
jgi:hypothetical protein